MLALLLTLFVAQAAPAAAGTAGAAALDIPPAATADALQALADVDGHLCVVVARKEVNVAPQVGGVLASVDVELGDRVQRGQALFRLDDQPLQHEVAMARATVQSAQAAVTRARVASEEATRRSQRRQEASEVYSSEDRDKARSEAEIAQAELQAAEGALAEQTAHLALLESNLQRTKVTAPFTGAVAGRYQQAGATVAAGTAVVRLIATAAPYVRFAVPPADAPRYAPNTQLQVRFADRDQPVRARVLGVAPEVDSSIEMVMVEAEFASDDSTAADVRVGMVGKVLR